MSKYDDIIDLPHYVSKTRTPMSMENRAAQFAPFAALTGLDAAMAEKARFVHDEEERTDEEFAELSRRVVYAMEKSAQVSITYFLPDKVKRGGSYYTIKGQIKRVNESADEILFIDGRSIPLGSICSVDGDMFSDFD